VTLPGLFSFFNVFERGGRTRILTFCKPAFRAWHYGATSRGLSGFPQLNQAPPLLATGRQARRELCLKTVRLSGNCVGKLWEA
jgi:hypothetical protein